jgi:hypothetical protein
MAITYHAGRRIQGLSTDVVATPTFEDDFTSDNWDDNTSSVVGVNTSNERFEFVAEAPDAANDSSVYDLGVSNISDISWILRWEVTYTGHVAGNGANHAFGLTATGKNSSSMTSDDGIMFCWGEPNTNTQSKMGVLALNGTSPGATGTFPNSSSRIETHLTDDTKYYCTLSRDSPTSSTFTIKTGSHDGTALSGFPLTNTADTVSGITGLRYIKFLNRSANTNRTGSSTGYIENLQFYNGTANKPTDVQVGSRFEETDTRKIYYRDDISFKELDGADAVNYRKDTWYEQLTGETP